MKIWLSLLAIVVGAACAPVITLTKTGTLDAKTKPADCDFAVFTAIPNRSFAEVAVVDIRTGPVGVTTAQDFRYLVGHHVCAVGGDAVFAEVNGYGQYIRGTIVVWTYSRME